MGGSKSSGTTRAPGSTAAIAPSPPRDEWVPSVYSTRVVDVTEMPGEKEAYETMKTVFTDLKKEIAKLGIPSPKKNASRMVSGYSTVTSPGVTVTLGQYYEQEGYQMKEIRTLDRQGGRDNRKRSMRWRYPTSIYVQGLTRSGLTRGDDEVKAWVAQVADLGRARGLKVHVDSDFRLTMSK